MSPRSVLGHASLLMVLAAYSAAVLLEPREGLGVLLTGALAASNFLLQARSLASTSNLIARAPDTNPGTLAAGTVLGSTIRWLVTFFLLWLLLERFHALGIVAGLSCMVGGMTLEAVLSHARNARRPDGVDS